MSGIIVVLVFCSGGICAGVFRMVRRRGQRDRLTREWIEFLREDLASSSL